MPNTKMIKAIVMPHFGVRLYQTDSGAYRVSYESTGKEEVVSEPINDYKTADLMFEMKNIELSGH